MNSLRILTVFFVLVLAGCLAVKAPRSLNDQPLVRLATLDIDGVFASDHSGQRIALGKNGLLVVSADGQEFFRVNEDSPLALSWSPDNNSLAAAFSLGDEITRVVVYTADGTPRFEKKLPVTLDRLIWSRRGDLLVVGHALKIFTFGGNLRQVLYRFDEATLSETLLSDTTIKPTSVKRFKEHLPLLLANSFSSSGDEIVYFRLHDPPEFPAFLQMVHRNWQIGGERLLLRFPVDQFGLEWVADDTAVTVLGRGGAALTVPVWQGAAEKLSEAQPGASIPRTARLQVLQDGSYLLAEGRNLYRGAGLPPAGSRPDDAASWQLRRWRFEGLITPQEYVNRLQVLGR